MAVPTWLFWTAQGFQFIIGVMLLVFASWYAYQRGSGKWGGGKELFDFKPIRFGGSQLKRIRVFKHGNVYMHDKGGDEGVMYRRVGMFGEEELPVKPSDIITVGDVVFKDRKGIEKAFGIYLENKHQIIVDLRNQLSYVKNALEKETHEREELVDYIQEQLAKSAKAVQYGQHKKSKRRSS